ncbi:MAG: hypothetical protein ACREDG_00140 [Methylocella sp.]
MIGDAKMQVWCDQCGAEEWRDMTALAKPGEYDDRNVRSGLKRAGWRVTEAKDSAVVNDWAVCPDCIENDRQLRLALTATRTP